MFSFFISDYFILTIDYGAQMVVALVMRQFVIYMYILSQDATRNKTNCVSGVLGFS